MPDRNPGMTVAEEVVGDFEYVICKDERGMVRSFYRLSDSPHHDLKRIPARDLPEHLKDVFAQHAGCTRTQLEI